jgi:uncharacterized protein (DUF4415 family)
MTTTTNKAENIDTENPEWTDEVFNKAKPASKVMPKLIGRGKQKKPVKVLTTIRLSNEVISYFKSDGKGWQSRIDAVLKEYVNKAHG